MSGKITLNRMELAGSFGDLGTIIPLGIGMIVVNGLDPVGVFWAIGLFYIVSGLYFRLPLSVEPMKIVGAYSIAAGMSAAQIQASSLWLAALLFFLGFSGLASIIGTSIPRTVVRGLQLSTGILLVRFGTELILGTSLLKVINSRAEPYLVLEQIGFLPVGIAIGLGVGLIALLLIDNKRFPAALVIVAIGVMIGVLWGTHENVSSLAIGIHLPTVLPHGMPSGADFGFVLLALVLPQFPMTLSNAVIATADLSSQYFPDTSGRASHKNLCLSMAFANVGSFLIGGMPMCHGAGGLASRYRFGARTGGANLIIGSLIIVFVLFLGPDILIIAHLMPLSVLGVLLLFAGLQLSLTISDLESRTELLVPLMMLGITLATNLAASFFIGLLVALLVKWRRLQV